MSSSLASTIASSDPEYLAAWMDGVADQLSHLNTQLAALREQVERLAQRP